MKSWKDTTSFSRNETNRAPREWTLELPFCRLMVHRHIDYGPDIWFVSTYGRVEISKRALDAKDSEAAKTEALGFLRHTLSTILKELP